MTSVPKETRQVDVFRSQHPGGGKGPSGRSDASGTKLPHVQVLAGSVIVVVVPARPSGFSVIRLKENDTGQVVVAVGVFGAVKPGQRIRLVGRWTDDPDYGRQFRVGAYPTPSPPDLSGVERFLASGIVPGVGPGLARRVVENLGSDLCPALDHRDERRLARVPGVGTSRARAVLAAWHKDPIAREALVYLLGLDIPRNTAFRIVHHLHAAAVRVVNQDPYRLARDVPGIGFQGADDVAHRVHGTPDRVSRACEAVRHLLETSEEGGHVCLPVDTVVERLSVMEVAPADALRALASLEASRAIVVTRWRHQGRRVVYLKRLYRAERFVGQYLLQMASRPPTGSSWRAEQDLVRIEATLGLTLDERQREAVKASFSAPLLVVTGGPGTGKTTIIKAMVALAEASGIQVVLAAPTGRAAQRLKEATGRDARTLHRLLEVKPPDHRYRRNRENPIVADMLIVDEASMVDLPLFAALLDALRPGTSLVLVGDVDQLPPVRAGQVLWSIVASNRFPVIVLDRVFRQSGGSMIPINAHRILAGKMPLLARGRQAESADFFFLKTNGEEHTAALIEEVVCERLPRAYSLDPMTDILVLTPAHRGLAGVTALNARLQARLNPLARRGREGQNLFPGDKVLQKRNNYDLELFNGDIGRVISADADSVRVAFGDRELPLSTRDLADLEPAYALTVHKAQGSEAPAVVMALPGTGSNLLQREMLYTAVTRARRLVVLVGELSVLEHALRTRGKEERMDLLRERLVRGEIDRA